MIDKIGAIIIRGDKVLIARDRDKDMFFIPGGKREKGESDLETLTREVSEELGVAVMGHKYYKTFNYSNHDNTLKLKVTAFITSIDDEPKPTSEIAELAWVSKDNYNTYKLGQALRIIIPSLVKDGLI